MSSTSELGGAIKIIHGGNDGVFAVAGQRIQFVRASLVDAFNIPADAIAFVNGDQIEASYTLRAHDTLEFCKERGNKGIRRMFTKAQILREYTGHPAEVMGDLFAMLRHDDVNADGQPVWHEAAVDEWLDQRYSRKRGDDGQDKVIPPNSVRIGGTVYDDLTLNEWRLIEVLLTAQANSVMVDDVITHLYADDAPTTSTSNRLKQAIKRLNHKGLERRWPFTVHVENGWVRLVK